MDMQPSPSKPAGGMVEMDSARLGILSRYFNAAESRGFESHFLQLLYYPQKDLSFTSESFHLSDLRIHTHRWVLQPSTELSPYSS